MKMIEEDIKRRDEVFKFQEKVWIAVALAKLKGGILYSVKLTKNPKGD